MPKSITITEIKVLGGQGKLAMVTYTVAGQTAKAKAWASDVEGKEGKTLDVEFEKKDGYNGGPEEVWIKVPKSGGRGGGGGFGGGKPDPAKAENDRKRLELEGIKHEDFLRKWDRDREGEVDRQASIESSVVLKCAVEMAIAIGSPDTNMVAGIASDLAETLNRTRAEIFRSLKARSAQGNNQ